MAHQLKNLDIPDDLYQELQKRAEQAHVLVGDELLHLAAAAMLALKTNDLADKLRKCIDIATRSGNSLLLSPAREEQGSAPKRHALDILSEMPGHQAFHTAEEVDRYVREERESWEG